MRSIGGRHTSSERRKKETQYFYQDQQKCLAEESEREREGTEDVCAASGDSVQITIYIMIRS